MSESTASVAETTPAEWSSVTAQVHGGFESGTGAPMTAGPSSAPWSLSGTKSVRRTFAAGSDRYARVATIGDVRSLVIHPASMTHPLRLAAGAEHMRADLCARFAAAAT
ncbi:hypothetical protein [Nocardia pneumoniae]|uniref:hypothetical protein n=1 Tax=Nocardia pneumoniae TaxID=228601 RepID=UPI0002E2C0FD|nr:hypothetical protein [Nocardia pneumoniae]